MRKRVLLQDLREQFRQCVGALFFAIKALDEFAVLVDPDDDRRAPFVARALSALARYVKDGLQTLPGVAEVRIFGERRPSMRIWLTRSK